MHQSDLGKLSSLELVQRVTDGIEELKNRDHLEIANHTLRTLLNGIVLIQLTGDGLAEPAPQAVARQIALRISESDTAAHQRRVS